MRVLTIAKCELKCILTNKIGVCMTLLMPILLTFLLGNAMKSLYDAPVTKTVNVGFVSGTSEVSDTLYSVLTSGSMQNTAKVTSYNNEPEALKALGRGDITAVIVPIGNQVNMYTSPQDQQGGQIISNVTQNVLNGLNAKLILHDTPESESGASGVRDTALMTHLLRPGATDYLSITMAVMTMLFCIVLATSTYTKKVESRISASSVSRTEITAGEVLGVTAGTFVQVCLVLAINALLFSANYGGIANVPFVLFVLLTLTFFMTLLGAFISNLMGGSKAVEPVCRMIALTLPLIGGGYFKINAVGWLKTVQDALPNVLAQNAIFSSIYKGYTYRPMLLVGILWAAIAAVFVFNYLVSRRRELI